MVASKLRKAVVVTMPLKNLPAGAFIRSSKVLPYLTKYFNRKRYKLYVYIPYTLILKQTGYCKSRNNDLIIKELSLISEKYRSNSRIITNLLASKQFCNRKHSNNFRVLNTLSSIYISFVRRIEEEIAKIFIDQIGRDVSFIYSMHENIEALIAYDVLLSLIQRNVKGALMLQSVLNESFNLSSPIGLYKSANSSYLIRKSIKIIEETIDNHYTRLLLGISPVVFTPTRVYNLKHKGVHLGVVDPGNAVDNGIACIEKPSRRKPYVVYFGRLSIEKGLKDILEAWKIIQQEVRDSKLYLIGDFASRSLYSLFKKYIIENNLKNIYYLGKIPHGDKLWRILTRMKVLIYPSYTDTFSLTILEAVFLGLSVVAYKIPVVETLYSHLPVVKTVKIGNVEELANGIIDFLAMNDREFNMLFENVVVKNFLEKYSSWSNVARAEYRLLARYLDG